MREIEVVLSMPLYHHRLVRKNSIAVIIDVLRTTTSIVAALEYGVKSIIPVSSKAEAEVMKHEGYLLAAEEDSKKLSFADYGISADEFWQDSVKGKEIVYSTANGTKAFRLTREESDQVVVGAFPNLTTLAHYLSSKNKNIVLVCAGFNNMPTLEDQLFAGALGQQLLQNNNYSSSCDSLTASIDIWNLAKENLLEYVKKISHRKRRPNLLSNEVINYTFTPDSSKIIPILHFNQITGIRYEK
jgi:2-phosphosulfolactate phosphatase